VGDGTHRETWGEELEVMHNPRANIPLPMNVLSDLFHIAPNERGVVRALYRDADPFHPYGSITIVIQPDTQGRRATGDTCPR